MNHSVAAVVVGVIIATGAWLPAIAATPPRTVAGRDEARPQIPGPYELALNKAQSDLGKAQWRYLRAVRERTRAIAHQAAHRAAPDELSNAIAAADRAAEVLSAATAAVKRVQQDASNTTLLASGR